MNDFVSKPVAPDVLYTVVLNWLENPRPVERAGAGGESR
jgi:hypothetical protein